MRHLRRNFSRSRDEYRVYEDGIIYIVCKAHLCRCAKVVIAMNQKWKTAISIFLLCTLSCFRKLLLPDYSSCSIVCTPFKLAVDFLYDIRHLSYTVNHHICTCIKIFLPCFCFIFCKFFGGQSVVFIFRKSEKIRTYFLVFSFLRHKA